MPRSFFDPQGEQDAGQAPLQPPNMLQAVLPQQPTQQQAQQPSINQGLGLLQYLQDSRDRREARADRAEARAFAQEDQAMQRTRFDQDQEDRAFSRSLTEEDQAMQREQLGMRREEFARNMRMADEQQQQLELGKQRDAARQRIAGRRNAEELNPLANDRQINDAAMLALAEEAKSGRWGEAFDRIDTGYRELSTNRQRDLLKELDADLAMLPTDEAELIRSSIERQAMQQAGAFGERYNEARERMVAGLDLSTKLRVDAATRAEIPLRMTRLEADAKKAFDESPRGFEVQGKMGNLGPVAQLALSAADEEERKAFLDSGEGGEWVRELTTRISGEDAARLAMQDFAGAYRSAELGNDFRVQAAPTFMVDDFANLLANPAVQLKNKVTADQAGKDSLSFGPFKGRRIPLDKEGRFFAEVKTDPNEATTYYERVGREGEPGKGKRPGPARLVGRVKQSFFGATDDAKEFNEGATNEQEYAKDMEALQEFWSSSTLRVYEMIDGKPAEVETIADPIGAGRQQTNALLERLGMLEMVPGSTRGKVVPDPETGGVRVEKPLSYSEWRNRVEPLARSLRRSTLGPLQKSIESALEEIPGAKDAIDGEKNKAAWLSHLSGMLLGGSSSQDSWLQMKLAEGVTLPQAMAAFEEQMVRPAIASWVEEDQRRATTVSKAWDKLRPQVPGKMDAAMRAYRAMDRSVLAPNLAQIKMGLETDFGAKTSWRDSRGAPGNVSPVEFKADTAAAREWNRWGTALPAWWDQRFAGEPEMLDIAHTYARIRTRLHSMGTGEDAIYKAFDELGKPGAFSHYLTQQGISLLDSRKYALKNYAARHRETVDLDPILSGMMRFFNVP